MNARQKAFVREYAKDFNAAAAAVRAGYSAKGSNVTGSQLLANPNIAAAVRECLDRGAKRAELSVDMVLSELKRIAFTHMGKLATWGGASVTLKESSSLSEEDMATVSEVQETTSKEGGSLKVKQYDKVKALELLGRHLGMWNDKLELVDEDRPLQDLSDAELVKLRGNGK